MKKLTKTSELIAELITLLKKGSFIMVVDGKNILSVKLGLGMKGGDDSHVLSEKDSDVDHDWNFRTHPRSRSIWISQTKKKIMVLVKRNGKRPDPFILGLEVFSKNTICREISNGREQESVFSSYDSRDAVYYFKQTEQDTSERKQLLENLGSGEYPSLSRMDDDPVFLEWDKAWAKRLASN